MTEEDNNVIADAIEIIATKLENDADRHWSTYVYQERFPGDTPFKKYAERWAENELKTLASLRNMLDRETAEDDES